MKRKPSLPSSELYGIKFLRWHPKTFFDEIVAVERYYTLSLSCFICFLVSSGKMAFKYTCIFLLVSVAFLLAQAKVNKKEKEKQNGERCI